LKEDEKSSLLLAPSHDFSAKISKPIVRIPHSHFLNKKEESNVFFFEWEGMQLISQQKHNESHLLMICG
jgi:hypothetical protein